MEKPIGQQPGQRPTPNAEEEIKAADHPMIRLLQIPKGGNPAMVAQSRWAPCTPAEVDREGKRFSAVAYFFGRRLQKELDVPIGLIHSSWGGTRIEPWTPVEGFDQFDSLRKYGDAARSRGPTTRGINQAAAGLYDVMIKPMVPFGIRGAIWYQGESNVMQLDREVYLEKMKALVGGWRKVWGQGDFPFYYVQLAPYTYSTRPNDRTTTDDLPAAWEAQTAAMKQIPNTGMVVTTDLVDNVRDIHPIQKREVGERLAGWALAKTYGRNLDYSGPMMSKVDLQGARAVVSFEFGKGLKSADGKPLTHFEVAGLDGVFHPAEATIEGENVSVSSPSVPNVKYVRFAWSETAMPNLANGAGLPAGPFRSDNLPLKAPRVPPTTKPEPSSRPAGR